MTVTRAIVLLAACVLAAGAPIAPAKENEKQSGRESAPGQEKKAAAPAPTDAGVVTSSEASPETASATEVAASSGQRSASSSRSARGTERSASTRKAAVEEPAAPAPAAGETAAPPAPTGPVAPAATTPRVRIGQPRVRDREPRRTRRERPRAQPLQSVAGDIAEAPAVTSPAASPVAAPSDGAAEPRDTAPRAAERAIDRLDAESLPIRLPGPVVEFVEVVPRMLRSLLAVLGVLSLIFAAAFAGVSARARRSERRRRDLSEDIGLLQSALLPELPAQLGGLAISAAYRPSDGPAAGGDFYDAFALDEHRTCMLVGDVAGHGRDALPLTAAVRFTVRAHLESGAAPRQALALAGRTLDAQLRGRLVTVVAAVYDSRTGELTYACAGHPAPVIAGEQWPREVAGSLPLGAGAPTGRRSTTIGLAPGAVVCLHTDGLHDVRVPGGRYGADRLGETLAEVTDAADLLARVTEGSVSQPDDMAALVLRVPDTAPHPTVARREELEVDSEDLAGHRPQRFLAACGISGPEASQLLSYAADRVREDGTAVMTITPGTSSRLTNRASV